MSMIISQLTFNMQSRLDVLFISVYDFNDKAASPSNQCLKLHSGKWLGLSILHSFVTLDWSFV